MCLTLWIALRSNHVRRLRQFGLILLCAASVVIARGTQRLEGVVLSNHGGADAHRVGEIRLAVAGKVYELTYGEPVPKHFESRVCWDIGAIWAVTVRALDSSLDIESERCRGVDENAHGPWVAVRDYLERSVTRSASTSTLLSSRWRSSPDFQKYRDREKELDFGTYRFHGRRGGCVDIVTVEPPDRAELRAGGDCFIDLSGRPAYLVFHVVRDRHSGRWQIDEIEIEAYE